MISRRALLRMPGGLALAGLGLASYSVVVEPNFLLDVTRYRVTPQDWPGGLRLKIAIITDLHACEPWMPVSRIRKIARLTNALQPDLVALLGDFAAGTHLVSGAVPPEQWAEALSELRAPLGVHAVLGNHDWWHGPLVSDPGDHAEAARRALKQMGARVYENDALRLTKDGQPFWILGLGDQMATYEGEAVGWRGHDDLPGTVKRVSDDAPAILLAHEPQVFHRAPKRIALTLCGHTHGGQVNLPLLGPVVAELRYGASHVYGHHVDDGRHLVISGGLGESIAPVRFMRPPEIVEVTVEAGETISPADRNAPI
ncbi:metallophosphoesterase [Methylocystis parvus]|uniref:Metallophosphoesterase n=1 Tax=Methylocystis parvus TaxID=134 RepID=A0A6B8M490_9HYPH|nr:metallophosphoesterase [Methylocystis parvus]QGM98724.1 metallophosphoesterase [Methylocystis parvus]WBK00927.1 metallophosphoesterase [Methylocystis parvus OBBP]